MTRTSARLIHLGERVSDSHTFQEDKIWSRYSSDKIDIGQTLTKVIRTLDKALPLIRPMRALSIGSSNEPQYRILQSAFRGGLYLLDIEESALDLVKERMHRQNTNHVHTIQDDYNKAFLDPGAAKNFLNENMGAKCVELVTLQHSMYYCPAVNWYPLIKNLYSIILAPKGAVYAVLMSSESNDHQSTTWLYNHFAGKFCTHKNNQDLLQFGKMLRQDPFFENAEIRSKTSRVEFFVEDFGQFMSVIWMILLYPQVHHYTLSERHEITEYVYEHFFAKKKPLIQCQDHLVIYRGLGIKGII
ncbi:MAG: class I SAM-dependent methyltransferase [Candidatus Omnitrophica bacterium]|nr:class I SAM-dependent methyltransferase [Candidatus Omnitrophota bacterium]